MAAWTRSEELDRPENKGLKDIMGKLKKAKAAIDAGGEGLALLSPGPGWHACVSKRDAAPLSLSAQETPQPCCAMLLWFNAASKHACSPFSLGM